jgi:uncharacterized protein (DUF433 family)
VARFEKILETPIYNLVEAAHYTRVPYQTLRYWTQGRDSIRPLITLASTNPARLSFVNLMECHMLSGMRREYNLRILKVRTALLNLAKVSPSKHPLIDQQLETDRVDLFFRDRGRDLVNLNNPDQRGFQEMLEMNMERISRTSDGLFILFPFVEKRSRIEPKIIMINPAVSFGRPVISGTGIPTAILASRFHARESVSELAREYGRTEKEVEEAIRWESRTALAA